MRTSESWDEMGSGDPYLSHPVAVALHAASWGLAQWCVEAALLHDASCPDLSLLTPHEMRDAERYFGRDVRMPAADVGHLGEDGATFVELAKLSADFLALTGADSNPVLVTHRALGCLPPRERARFALEWRADLASVSGRELPGGDRDAGKGRPRELKSLLAPAG